MCWGCLPFDEIFRQGLLIKPPVGLVHNGTHFHRVLSGGEVLLNNPSCVDESLPRSGIDVHGILVMRHQHIVNWMKHTQLPVCGDDEGLDASMRAQTAK